MGELCVLWSLIISRWIYGAWESLKKFGCLLLEQLILLLEYLLLEQLKLLKFSNWSSWSLFSVETCKFVSIATLQGECSFVSLRDVERVLSVMAWFYRHREMLFPMMDRLAVEQIEDGREDEKRDYLVGGCHYGNSPTDISLW